MIVDRLAEFVAKSREIWLFLADWTLHISVKNRRSIGLCTLLYKFAATVFINKILFPVIKANVQAQIIGIDNKSDEPVGISTSSGALAKLAAAGAFRFAKQYRIADELLESANQPGKLKCVRRGETPPCPGSLIPLGDGSPLRLSFCPFQYVVPLLTSIT